jgi:4-nitrophenyl phosphatase
MKPFNTIRAVISDMDGVLWTGDTPLPGLSVFFDLLRAKSLPFALATNNSSKSPQDYVHKLERFGIPGVQASHILTSGTTTISYLRAHYPAGAPMHILGGDGLRQVVQEAGYTLADKDALAVIVGLDPQLNYDKLKRAALLIRQGATFIATNVDATIPIPEGLAPGAGSLVAALQTATETEPLVMGKPYAPMFEAALRLLGTLPSETLMIGDRLNTDIEGARRLGLQTALVLTGVATREQAETSPQPPDRIYSDLAALVQDWS